MEREITFANFSTQKATNLPVLKVLGWEEGTPTLSINSIAKDVTTYLTWPEDESDPQSWRQRWRRAFTKGHREVITTSRKLAVALAEAAKKIRSTVEEGLEVESEKGTFRRIHQAMRKSLIHDMTKADFADACAQTITYGLFAARIQGSKEADLHGVGDVVTSHPLLHDLKFAFLERGKGGNRVHSTSFDELGLIDVIELFKDANMDAVLRDFGHGRQDRDPVIHFYELFLQAYNPEVRVERGVFYTPSPVVSYIVRSANELLQREFRLADGLADTSTWKEVASRRDDVSIPDGVDPQSCFVQILDPATGTGTFLVEVIDVIHKTMLGKWKKESVPESEIAIHWKRYVDKYLIPRLYGFELLVAPYATAHIRVALKLQETGYVLQDSDRMDRIKIYLTNSLEPYKNKEQLKFPEFEGLAAEAKAVNNIKRKGRFTVVLGNPPYSGNSANKGDWIRQLLRGKDESQDGSQKIESYFEVDGKPLGERNPKGLDDDYVKYIRYGQWLLDRSQHGILGYITNHGYLTNLTFRGMRQSLMQPSLLYLLDLHGNTRRRERTPLGTKDDNVFDIQQGVAVGMFVRKSGDANTRVFHADLWGERNKDAEYPAKYRWLTDNRLSTTDWEELTIRSPQYFFIPYDYSLFEEYEKGWKLPEIFPLFSSGIVTARDTLTIQMTERQIRRVVEELVALPPEEARKRFGLRPDSDWSIAKAQEDLRRADGEFVPILYRPFDVRYTYYSGRAGGFHNRPRAKMMKHLIENGGGGGRALVSVKQVVRATFDNVLATSAITDYHLHPGGCYVFPLYLYEPTGR